MARVWGKTNKEGVRGAGKEDKGMKIGNMRSEKGGKQKEKKRVKETKQQDSLPYYQHNT